MSAENRYAFLATAAFGLEGLCKRELLRLGVVAPKAVERLGWWKVFLLCLRALAGGALP